MALLLKKLGEIEEVNAFLRGGIIGGTDILKATPRGGIYNLDGKTIVFTTPAATVTFATTPSGEQVGLTAKDIIAQINAHASIPAGTARITNGRLHLELQAPGPLVVSGGTALPLLGLPSAGFTTALINAKGGGAPELEAITTSPLGGGTYIMVINE